MSSVAQSLFRLFRGVPQDAAEPALDATPRFSRRSSGLAEFLRHVSEAEGMNILDLGPTSPANITCLTDKGHRVYNEDLLLASTDTALATRDENGAASVDVGRFLAQNLVYPQARFDAVLCWDVADYIHESLVKAMVGRLHSAMKPGGVALAFFHTRDAGPNAPHYRYNIAGKDTLDLQSGQSFRLQRVFNNRHIENLFRDFASLKFFLARDHIREVLVVR